MVTVTIESLVEDRKVEKMTTSEVATIKFTVKKKFPTLGYCSLKNYPYLKREEFYFIFTFNGNLIHFQKFHFELGKNEYVGKFTHQQEFAKKVEFMGRVISDAYYGLDIESPFVLDVVDVEQ